MKLRIGEILLTITRFVQSDKNSFSGLYVNADGDSSCQTRFSPTLRWTSSWIDDSRKIATHLRAVITGQSIRYAAQDYTSQINLW
ncbi:hypothetical protein OUZ56_004377 [Daphnia magna]|uniref:Uncharacterized protein n=1 Tax=Daphnia magna TaxID=35525 RepID=A0ABQ9YPM2_9CRUS|nr:hypothetical protein OUZ56_004377 [Daphnia magna]